MDIKKLLPFLLFIIIAGFLTVGLFLNPREVPSPLVGKPAPSFKAPVLGDASKSFSPADLKGQVWMLNVWASWCAACREEHPLLIEMRKHNMPLYGLAYKDTDAESLATLKTLGNPYIESFTDSDGKIGIAYGVYGVPETYIIDQQGLIRYKQIGPITAEALRDKILPLMRSLEQ